MVSLRKDINGQKKRGKEGEEDPKRIAKHSQGYEEHKYSHQEVLTENKGKPQVVPNRMN